MAMQLVNQKHVRGTGVEVEYVGRWHPEFKRESPLKERLVARPELEGEARGRDARGGGRVLPALALGRDQEGVRPGLRGADEVGGDREAPGRGSLLLVPAARLSRDGDRQCHRLAEC